MAYLVVPHEVSASTATIWIGAIDERFARSVDPGIGTRAVEALERGFGLAAPLGRP